jgi:biotin transport system permease protein
MLTLSIAGNSWAHKLPVGLKLLVLSLMTVALFPQTSVMLQVIVCLAILALYLTVGRSFTAQGLQSLRPLAWFVILVMLFHMFLRDIDGGIVVVLRMLILVALANFVTMTSKLSDFISLFEWLLTPFVRFGVNIVAISLAIAMVIRFTPIFIARGSALSQSWRARSSKRVGWRIILPLGLAALDDASHVETALRARGGLIKK